MNTKLSSLLFAVIFSFNTLAQTDSTEAHIFIRPAVGLGNFESRFRTSINEYLRPTTSLILDGIVNLESPALPNLSFEIAPANHNYFVNFKYQPIFS
ncbi:MAG: hypothetical protein ACKVOK_10950 [Flavobacteriales bacterium]